MEVRQLEGVTKNSQVEESVLKLVPLNSQCELILHKPSERASPASGACEELRFESDMRQNVRTGGEVLMDELYEHESSCKLRLRLLSSICFFRDTGLAEPFDDELFS
jgi:hypothetical protein